MKFRRQHPISSFIADFYCHQAKLIIEIDGGYHDDPDQQEADLGRQRALEDLGLKVIRFRNEEIETDVAGVVERIRRVLADSPYPPNPLTGKDPIPPTPFPKKGRGS